AGREVLVAGLIAIAALQIDFSRQHRRIRALYILAADRPWGDDAGERGDREAALARRSKVSHWHDHATIAVMKASIRQKLDRAQERFEEVGQLLSEPEVLARPEQFRELSVEYARLRPTADALHEYRRIEADLQAARGLLSDGDAGLRALGAEEVARTETQLQLREQALQKLLIPKDPRDERNIFLEIRAGTGGDEAALFAGDLLRMYSRFAEQQGWQVETVNENPGEHVGYREIICRIAGRGVFSRLLFGSGTHRVQRVPQTEAQGRVH